MQAQGPRTDLFGAANSFCDSDGCLLEALLSVLIKLQASFCLACANFSYGTPYLPSQPGLSWENTEVHEETLHPEAGQFRLKPPHSATNERAEYVIPAGARQTGPLKAEESRQGVPTL